MIPLSEAYSSKFEEARKVIDKEDFFRVFSHYDADGVSSALRFPLALMEFVSKPISS